MSSRLALVILIALSLAACGEKPGIPETETTATPETATTTSPASATTTGSTGGTVSALTPEDKEFLSSAGMAGLAQVQQSELALRTEASEAVQAFARRMVAEHSKSNAELQLLATMKGAALPTELAGAPQEAVHHLSQLTGAAFDSAYAQHMVADHRKAVADFEAALAKTQDADVRAWIEKTLPALRQHQQEAERLAAQ